MGSRSLTTSLAENSGSMADHDLCWRHGTAAVDIDGGHSARGWWCWGLIVASSGLISVADAQGWAMFALIILPKAVCVGRRLRPDHLWGGHPEISSAIRVRSVLVASLWSMAFAVAVSPVWKCSTLLLAIDAVASMIIVLAIRGERRVDPTRTEPVRPVFPASVRSWFQGRSVAICGTDRDLKILLSRRMTEAGAVVSEVATDDGPRIRERFREVRPSAVVMIDEVDESRQEENAVATRHTANEAMRIGAELLIRVAIFPMHAGRHEVSLSHRVLEALAGLTRTRMLMLGVPANRDRDDVARFVMRQMAIARPGVAPGPRPEDSQVLWRTLDRLEHRRSARHQAAIKGPRSPLEGSSQAPAR